jgi:hypothetical protein
MGKLAAATLDATPEATACKFVPAGGAPVKKAKDGFAPVHGNAMEVGMPNGNGKPVAAIATGLGPATAGAIGGKGMPAKAPVREAKPGMAAPGTRVELAA